MYRYGPSIFLICLLSVATMSKIEGYVNLLVDFVSLGY